MAESVVVWQGKRSFRFHRTIEEPGDGWRASDLFSEKTDEHRRAIEIVRLRAGYFVDKFLRRNTPRTVYLDSREDLISELVVKAFEIANMENYHDLKWVPFQKVLTLAFSRYMGNKMSRTKPQMPLSVLLQRFGTTPFSSDTDVGKHENYPRPLLNFEASGKTFLGKRKRIFLDVKLLAQVVSVFRNTYLSKILEILSEVPPVMGEYSDMAMEVANVLSKIQTLPPEETFDKLLKVLGYNRPAKRQFCQRIDSALASIGIKAEDIYNFGEATSSLMMEGLDAKQEDFLSYRA